jgi:outer membrane biosynthesis protein TonB
MNIDRHNYEENFLLYIDNELNVDQKKQVELFVQENPDLEEELVMLKQSRLIPDESIVFDKKHLLMKEEKAKPTANTSFINLNNYEQWLIMYVDDELNTEERVAVEKFAVTHPHVSEELAIFLQTKLQPEEIAFPNKEILYKRERTVRVISMQWWKVAVAAVLILSAGVTVYSVLINRSNNTTTTADVTKTNIEKKITPAQETTATPDKPQQPTVTPDQQQEEQLTTATPAKKESNEKEKIQEQPEEENSRQLAYNSTVQNVSEEQKPAIVEIDKPNAEQPKMNDAVAIDNKMGKEINTGAVTISNIQTPNDGQHDVVDQQAAGTENKKFRGFFRKATRLLERTTNIKSADDDKVLIGGMAINLK